MKGSGLTLLLLLLLGPLVFFGQGFRQAEEAPRCFTASQRRPFLRRQKKDASD